MWSDDRDSAGSLGTWNNSFCLSSSLLSMPCPTHITFCTSLAHLYSQIRALMGCIWVPLPVPAACKLPEGRHPGVFRLICASICTQELTPAWLAVQDLKTVVSSILFSFLITSARWGRSDTVPLKAGSGSHILFLQTLFESIILNQLTIYVWKYLLLHFLYFALANVKTTPNIKRHIKTGFVFCISWLTFMSTNPR